MEIEDNCDYAEHNYLEDGFCFEKDGIAYGLIEVNESDWDDEGKYQYQDITYQLASFDKSVKKWVCEESVIDKFDLYLILPVERSGSYFTDYYYSYSAPIIKIAMIKHVPEQIIPAHDEVVFKELD